MRRNIFSYDMRRDTEEIHTVDEGTDGSDTARRPTAIPVYKETSSDDGFSLKLTKIDDYYRQY